MVYSVQKQLRDLVHSGHSNNGHPSLRKLGKPAIPKSIEFLPNPGQNIKENEEPKFRKYK